jgi:hypothetical protein
MVPRTAMTEAMKHLTPAPPNSTFTNKNLCIDLYFVSVMEIG